MPHLQGVTIPRDQLRRLLRARDAIAWLEARGHLRSRGPTDFTIGFPFIWTTQSDKPLLDAIEERAAREAVGAGQAA